MFKRLISNKYLFTELVKRDFKKKYNRAVLGIGWSLLSPLLMLLVMKLVFTQFFGRTVEHYTTYLFSGLLVFGYFTESSTGGMSSLMQNADIFTKVNVPKYLFLLSKNVQTTLNFLLTLCVYSLFCYFDGIRFSWKFVLLVYPICTLFVFNIGLGLFLSAMFVFFRDMQYLWSVAVRLIMYGSAIFYTTDRFSPQVMRVLHCNPVFDHIEYVRTIVLQGQVPSLQAHLMLAGFAALAMLVGGVIYKRCNITFLYYV